MSIHSRSSSLSFFSPLSLHVPQNLSRRSEGRHTMSISGESSPTLVITAVVCPLWCVPIILSAFVLSFHPSFFLPSPLPALTSPPSSLPPLIPTVVENVTKDKCSRWLGIILCNTCYLPRQVIFLFKYLKNQKERKKEQKEEETKTREEEGREEEKEEV